MNSQTDPRLGMPSGSNALYDSLCFGRWRLQHDFAELEVEEDQGNGDDLDSDAEAGKRIHKLYAGETVPNAVERERQRAEQALAVDTKMHGQWADVFKCEPEVPIVTLREHRWWLKDDSGKPVYSGQTDMVKFRGKPKGVADILVADLKGLWGHHDPASQNMQIQRYIALIAVDIQSMGYSEVRSACAYLNQPAKTMTPAMVQYDREDIDNAIFQMQLDVAAIMDPDAPRTAGPVQCHRCRAKLLCAEYQEFIASLPAPIPLNGTPPDKAALTQTLSKLTGDRLASIIPWLPSLDNMVSLAKAEAKRRLRADPKSVPGYRLKKNAPRSKVTDLMLLWNRLSAKYPNITAAEFIALCSVTLGNVEAVTRDKSGLKGKALDETVKGILEGCTMPIMINDSLEEGEPE
jgi:hypothetical protein